MIIRVKDPFDFAKWCENEDIKALMYVLKRFSERSPAKIASESIAMKNPEHRARFNAIT
jgi:hypothetical protein